MHQAKGNKNKKDYSKTKKWECPDHVDRPYREKTGDARKTAIINDEFKRLNVDIAAFQETRLTEADTMKEKDYPFHWQGKRSYETRERGVGFAVKSTLLKNVDLGSNGSAQRLTPRLNITEDPLLTSLCMHPP